MGEEEIVTRRVKDQIIARPILHYAWIMLYHPPCIPAQHM